MPSVLANLLNSEKGVMALLVVVATAVLTACGKITLTTDQWLEYSTLWLGIYTGGKTVQGAAAAFANRGVVPIEVLTPAPAPIETSVPASAPVEASTPVPAETSAQASVEVSPETPTKPLTKLARSRRNR